MWAADKSKAATAVFFYPKILHRPTAIIVAVTIIITLMITTILTLYRTSSFLSMMTPMPNQ